MSDSLEKFKETPTFCPNCGTKESMYPLLSLDKGVDKIRKCRKCGYEVEVLGAGSVEIQTEA